MIAVPVTQIQVSLDFGNGASPVGLLAIRGGKIYFQYDTDFLGKGLALSPFRLPLITGLHKFDSLLFEGLPGVFNDSLPDGWGRLLFDRLMRTKGVVPEVLSPLDRLAHIGASGMGAIVYEPSRYEDIDQSELDLDWFARQSQDVLQGRVEDVLDQLFVLNGSSTGARPKALVGYHGGAEKLIYGSQDLSEGYEPWLVKFANTRDGPDAGAVEFVYSEMAQKAGINFPDTHLFPARQGGGYFAVKRFDREQGNRLHMHTVCGLLHSDYRAPALDYQDLLELTMRLTRDVRESEKMFQLAAFNIMAHNRDDHSKNFSFLMDKTGEWKLAPAYDLTFSYGPGGEQGTTVMGEGKSPDADHLRALGHHAGIKHNTVEEILDRTKDSLMQWSKLSKSYDVRRATRDLIQTHINRF